MDSGCLEEDGCFFLLACLNLIINLCFFFRLGILYLNEKKILSCFCEGFSEEDIFKFDSFVRGC